MKPMQWSLSLAAALAVAGCAEMQQQPVFQAPGTTWVYAVRNTGSYGNVNAEQTSRAVGERMWQGRKVYASENTTTGISFLRDPDTGRWIANARGDTPLASVEPPLGWDRPVEVGKTWTRNHRFTNHANKTTTDFVGTWKVEAYEDMTVRAGTFKAYKIVHSDNIGGEGVTWWNPEMDMWVKQTNRRTAKHPAGPGTNEVELVQRPTAP